MFSDYANFQGSQDFEKLNKTSVKPQNMSSTTRFLSLNSVLGPDEVLAIAFQYTIGNNTYQVGEFSSNGQLLLNPCMLIVEEYKLFPYANWDLMMKNIYSLEPSLGARVLLEFYENTINKTITNYLSEPSEPIFMEYLLGSWLRPIKSTARS